MKKRFVSLVGMLLCVTLLLTMTGCGERVENAAKVVSADTTATTAKKEPLKAVPPTDARIVGDWEGTFDKSVQYTNGFGFEINASMPVKVTFQADGYCVAEYNQAMLYTNVINSVVAYCDETGTPLEEFLAKNGHDYESFRLHFVEKGDIYKETRIYNFTGSTFVWQGVEVNCVFTDDTLEYELLGGQGKMTLTRVQDTSASE